MEHNKVQKEKTLQCWNKVGLFLCTNGSAKVSINGQNFGLTRGMLFVISPLVQVRDMVPAADFESVFFVDDLKVSIRFSNPSPMQISRFGYGSFHVGCNRKLR